MQRERFLEPFRETRRRGLVQESQFAMQAVERPLGVRVGEMRPRGLELFRRHAGWCCFAR